jgi:hypothetical protein
MTGLARHPLELSLRKGNLRLKFILVTAFWLFALVQVAAAECPNDSCDLPKDLQSVVEGKYPGTKIVTLSDISEDDKQLFQKEHADSCPRSGEG